MNSFSTSGVALRCLKLASLCGLIAIWPSLTEAQITLNALTDSLYVTGPWTQQGRITFSNTQPRYTPAVTRFGIQLHNRAFTNVDNPIDITNLNGSPILGAHGLGTVLAYNGAMEAAGGRTFASIAPINYGRVLIGGQARINLVLAGSYFTRQFWCYSDGTGTIEFDSAFVADRTNLGTVANGLGSIRLSKCNLLTHSTKSLPKGYRPGNGGGPALINAHLVFDDRPGSVWETQTYPQEYVGGLWVQSAYMTLNTQTDLTLSGVRSVWTDYTNWGGTWFQKRNAILIKRGPAKLILSGDQGYTDSSQVWVKQGTIVFASPTVNPGLISFYNNSTALPDVGNNLHLTIDSVGMVQQSTPKVVAKSVKLISPNASYQLQITDTISADTVACAGRLVVTFPSGYDPWANARQSIRIIQSPNIIGRFDSLDVPDLTPYSNSLFWKTDSIYINGSIYIDHEVGIHNNLNALGAKAWPNPASQFVKIQLPHNSHSAATISWINSLGQTIATQTTELDDQGQLQLSRKSGKSLIPTGQYRLLIKTNKGTYTSQVVWQ